MTATIGTTPIGGGAYTDAQAVAATVSFRASGEDLYSVLATPLAAVRTSYRLATTPPLEAGIYFVSVGLSISGSAQGTDVAGDVEVNGVALGAVLSESGLAGGGFLLSVTASFAFTAGTNTIEYFAWHPSGPGTGSALGAFTAWARER